MSDYVVFAQLPYVAVLGCLIAIAARQPMAVLVGTADSAGTRDWSGRWRRVVIACTGLVIAEHVLLLSVPAAVLRWNREAPRLLVLEGIGVGAGVVCALAAIASLRRQLFPHGSHAPTFHRTLTRTIVAIAVASGVVVAIAYRWASSWSVVTLTPYVVSLAKLNPRIELVASTPFAVRLHVLGGFAFVVLLPFTDVGSAALAALWLSIQAAAWSAAEILKAVGARVNLAPRGVLRSELIWPEEER
jgi:nitrate reductase gamma subunit